MNMIRTRGLGNLLFLGAALFFWGCEAPPGKSSIAGGEGRPVVIGDGGVNLEFGPEQLARALSRMPVRVRNRIAVEARGELFDAILLQELVFAEGMRAGLDQDPEIQKQMANHLRQLVQSRVLADLAETAEVSDDEVAAYYQENRGKFATRKIRARHILLKDRSQAEKVRGEALANPEAFPALAKRYSLDQSSGSAGGDLGFFGYGKMTPEFEQAAFMLEEPLEISAVIESPSGFHVIQATDFRPGRERALSEVQAQVRALLLRRLVDAEKAKLFQRLRESVAVSMDPAAMEQAFGMMKVVEQPEEARHGGH